MIATEFKEQTAVLKAENCFDLPVFSNGEIVISKWLPDAEELEKLNNGEGIYLFVVSGSTQPPVNLIVGSPFTYTTHDTSSTENTTERSNAEA